MGHTLPRRRKDEPEPTAEQNLAEELVTRARELGVSLASRRLQRILRHQDEVGQQLPHDPLLQSERIRP